MMPALPTHYPSNLCDLPVAEQQAIEQDKQLWYSAYLKYTTEPREQVLTWLQTLPSHQAKDMRRRLNQVNERAKIKHKQATQNMQAGLTHTRTFRKK